MPLEFDQPPKNIELVRPRRIWHSILTLDERPHAVALGAAIGVFIGLTPSMPVQSLLAILAASLLRVSRASALAGVWINNPFTIIPIYSGSYALGCLISGEPLADLDFAFLTDSSGPWLAQAQHLWGVFYGILWPLLVGSLLIASLGAAISYVAIFFGLMVLHARRGSKT